MGGEQSGKSHERILTAVSGYVGSASFLSHLCSLRGRLGNDGPRTQDPGNRSAHQPSLLCIARAGGTKNTVLEDLCKESPTMQQHRAGTKCVVQHTTPSRTRTILEFTEPEVNQQPCSQSFLFGLHTKLPGNLVISTPLNEAACFFSYEAICFLYGMASFL